MKTARPATLLALALGAGLLGNCSVLAPSGSGAHSWDKGLTTNFSDAYPEYPPLEHRTLGKPKSLESVPRDPQGRFVLRRGYYALENWKTY